MAGPFNFGTKSQSQIVTMHHDLQIIANDVVEIYDISAHQGARTVEEQIRNIEKRVSKTLDSCHIPRDEDGNYDPNGKSWAGDFLPHSRGVNPWPQDSDSRKVREKKKARFYYMQGIFRSIAHKHNISIRQGTDWDMDDDLFDQTFDDLPHVELYRPRPKLIVTGELLEMANEALKARGLKAYG